MTRINFGITPKQLTDQHLLAEFRELPRIPRAVKRNIIEGKPVNVNTGEFTLGEGHVRWFYNKLSYLHMRYGDIYSECIHRLFNVSYDSGLFRINDTIKDSELMRFYNDISVQSHPAHVNIVKERISTRIRESKQQPRYRGEPIDKEHYIKTILEWK